MDIRRFDDTPADAQAWEAYVARCPQATSDHRWGWRRVLARTFGFTPHFLAAVAGEQVHGILPLFEIPRGFRRIALVSIPFGNYGGICADSPAATAALLAAAKELLAARRGAYLELRHRVPLAEATLRQSTHQHSRFVLPLASDPAIHARRMGQNNRSKVHRAVRRGLRTVLSQDVGRLYPIYVHTARRQGTPCFPRRYFEEILRTFGDTTRILFVVKGPRTIAFDVLLAFKDSLVCQFSGSLASFYDAYPNDFLFWSAIQHGCALGMKELDFCRSRIDSGTAAFKRKLRFAEEPLDFQYYLPSGQAVSMHGRAEARWQWAIRAWQHLPLAMTRLLGPTVIRYFA